MHPRADIEEVKKQFASLNPHMKLLDKPVRLKDKVRMKCADCGTTTSRGLQYAASRKITCPGCSESSMGVGVSHKRFCEVVSSKGPGYKVLSRFVNMGTRVEVACKRCGHERNMSPQILYYRSKPECPECRVPMNIKGDHKTFEAELKVKKPHIKIVGTYRGYAKKLEVHCTDCDYRFESTPDVLLNAKFACLECSRMQTGYARKKVTVRGRTFIVQGFEDVFLKKLARTRPKLVKEILTGKGVPIFHYVGRGANNGDRIKRHYRPDFFVPSDNRIIEIKSDYTAFGNKSWYSTILKKRSAVVEAGYKFTLVVFDKGQRRVELPEGWHALSYSSIRSRLALA